MESTLPQKQPRIAFLDALRGIAVGCIFMANIAFFSGFIFFPPNQRLSWASWPTDDILGFVTYTLIDGKFYTIFSLLFGMGCAIQFHSVGGNATVFKAYFRRRMFWLLFIGCIHLFLIWLGDILTLYALLGMLLPLFINTPNNKLLRYAVILNLLPILNQIITDGLGWDYPGYCYDAAHWVSVRTHTTQLANMPEYLQNDHFINFFKANLSNAFVRMARILDDGRPFKVFGIFLMGLWAGRNILFHNLLSNTTLLRKIAKWGLVLGLPCSAARTCLDFADADGILGLVRTICYALGTVPLALAYAAMLALWYRKNPAVLRIFEPVGKTALTNYLMQSCIAIVLFYGIGFGFAGKFGFTVIWLIACAVFAWQIVMSRLWLSIFTQGPVEAFWRYAAQAANKQKK